MDKVYVIGRDPVPSLLRLDSPQELRLTFVALPGACGKVSVEVDIDSAGCSLDMAGLYLCSSDEQLGFDVLVRHNCGGSVSRQNFRGLVGGTARAAFNGLIYVAPGAQKTRASQESHAILLGDKATVKAQPQLEIFADDVECTHGCTSGFLSDDELFYMRSRGIPEQEARRLQKIAFIAPVVSRLPEDLAEQVYASIA
ncbi:MAG TPA: SufD family Fe-S cluster assembly protein [Candidatus Cryptobacteroides pullicola]|nr:SufD family Fe-S cluster assembly protein [Candidatus Cryptobacteroides pullicola]